MRMKNKLIGVGVGLVLVAAAGVWAFAAQGVVGSPSDPTPDSTSGVATSEATATESDALATETPEPADLATATPNLTPGAGDCEGGPDVDETGGTDASATPDAADPCNIEQEGEIADGDQGALGTHAIDQSTPHPGDTEKDHPEADQPEATGD